ncbi:MAG: hypothetical protein JNK87_13825 [Bryobacterales bacterium]|nr:hypothetical protein [Bryobacterales bacterium]
MRLGITAFCLFTISAAAADRTLTIRHAGSTQAQNELATAVRSILELPSVNTDTDRRTLTISGTDTQIAAAEWLLAELDKPAAQLGDKSLASRVFRMEAMGEEGLRVFYLQGSREVRQLQETATIIRSIVETRRLFTYNQVLGIVVRGTPVQLDAAEWLWRTLEANTPAPRVEEFRAGFTDGQPVLRAYRMPMEWSVPQLQEAATLLRAIVEIRRVFTFNGTRTILTRGDEESLAAANWVATETQRPASADLAVSAPYRMADPRDEGLLRVFRLPAAKYDAAGLQRIATDLRAQTQIRRIFTFNTPRMIALRGTGEQIAHAERILTAAK